MTEVVFVHERYPFGGAERVTQLIAEGMVLVCPDVHVKVLASHFKRDELPEISGIDYVDLPEGIRLRHHDGQQRLTEILSRIGADVVIFPEDLPPVDLLTTIRSGIPGVKIIYQLHSKPMWQVVKKSSGGIVKKMREKLFGAYTRRYTRRYREVYRAVDRFCVLCDGYRDEVARLVGDDSRITAMYNPVMYVSAGNSSPESHGRTVLYVGRLSYEDKRLDRLMRIWVKVVAEHPDWRLKIVGDGPERSSIESMAVNLGIADSVDFCGYTADPSQYYAEASVVCLTSQYEGWGLVLVEGQMAGAVPIAMDCCAGVREVLSDGRGVIVPLGDEEMFARELSALITDPARREAMRPAMAAFAARFTPEKVAQNWLRLINEICD